MVAGAGGSELMLDGHCGSTRGAAKHVCSATDLYGAQSGDCILMRARGRQRTREGEGRRGRCHGRKKARPIVGLTCGRTKKSGQKHCLL